MPASPRYRLVHRADLDTTPCPCGCAKRAFADEPAAPASFHVVRIRKDTRTHDHKRMTEIYHALEGEGRMELDGEQIPVRPGSTVMIQPSAATEPWKQGRSSTFPSPPSIPPTTGSIDLRPALPVPRPVRSFPGFTRRRALHPSCEWLGVVRLAGPTETRA